ncbi:MAG: hypothetical protein HKN34_06125 [Gammaproteobacteria bacterium]|nr:hypothetical protein [Gammaproteobacteria bacterium]
MNIPVKSKTRANPVYRDEELPSESTSHTGSMAALIIYPEIVKLHQIEQSAIEPGEAITGLQPMLYSSDPVVRIAALESVAELKSPKTLPILIEALNDYLPSIRKASIEGLSLQADGNVARVIEPFLFDNDISVKIAAIDALAALGGEQAINSLASLLNDYDPIIRNNAMIALGEIDNPFTSQYILPLQFDPDLRIRSNAASILLEQESKK